MILRMCAMLLVGVCLTACKDSLQASKESTIHFDERPKNTKVDTIVLHASERSSMRELRAIFNHKSYPVSAHYAISKNGEIVQFLDDSLRAWHAGVSKMPDGRENVNDFSIGIELVNKNDGSDPYPAAQLEALLRLIKKLLDRHPIAFLVSHSKIAVPPGRKSDPKGFPFEKLNELSTLSIVP